MRVHIFTPIVCADIKTSLKMSLKIILAIEFFLWSHTSDVCACVDFSGLGLVCVFVDVASVALHVGAEAEKRIAV